MKRKMNETCLSHKGKTTCSVLMCFTLIHKWDTPYWYIDKCISEEIGKLKQLGIRTKMCCCGHTQRHPWVSVIYEDKQRMLDLGYRHRGDQYLDCTVPVSHNSYFLLKTEIYKGQENLPDNWRESDAIGWTPGTDSEEN